MNAEPSEKMTRIAKILACPGCLSPIEWWATGFRCKDCAALYPLSGGAVLFTDPLNEHYLQDDVAYAKNKTTWSAFKKRNYDFIDRETMNLAPENIILDIGAGPGFFEDLFENFKEYYQLDVQKYPNIDIVTNIATQNLPIRTAVADCIVLSNVLEHMSKPEKMLSESFRVLKAGGKIIIIVPFMFKIHQAPHDFYRYTQYKLREMLVDFAFQNVVIIKMGNISEVLNGIQYEFRKILRENTKHPFLLEQFLRVQNYIDRIIKKLFLKLSDRELTDQDVFVGYACTAEKLHI